MVYIYSFHGLKNDNLIHWLEENEISYSLRENFFVCFDIKSSDNNADFLLKQLRSMRIIGPTRTAKPTKRELSCAKFLTLVSKKQWIDIINVEEAYQISCRWQSSAGLSKAGHMEPIAPFKIAKEPSTESKTAFWHEDTGFGELFTDNRIYNLAQQNGLNGMIFKPVYLKSGKVSSKIFQVTSSNTISTDSIEFGYGEKQLNCHICGKEQYFIDSAYQLHLRMDKMNLQQDFYVTERIFGEGIPEPVYVISQRFYQLLNSNKLTGNLILLPIVEALS